MREITITAALIIVVSFVAKVSTSNRTFTCGKYLRDVIMFLSIKIQVLF